MSKTPRMEQIEALLATDPDDAFLRYGLAMEYFSLGEDATGVAVLNRLIAEVKPPYVPAYLMAGQAYLRMEQPSEAARVLREGIEVARQQGNDHARGEMEGFLSTIE